MGLGLRVPNSFGFCCLWGGGWRRERLETDLE